MRAPAMGLGRALALSVARPSVPGTRSRIMLGSKLALLLCSLVRITAMRCRHSLVSIALAAAFGFGIALLLVPAAAQDASRLPDWKGQWIRTGAGTFDPTQPPELRQGAPLTPEDQAVLEASVAAAAGGAQD